MEDDEAMEVRSSLKAYIHKLGATMSARTIIAGGEEEDEQTEQQRREEQLIVEEVLKEGRTGERNVRGEREEWNQHVGWHRKETIHGGSRPARLRKTNTNGVPQPVEQEQDTKDTALPPPQLPKQNSPQHRSSSKRIVPQQDSSSYHDTAAVSVPGMLVFGCAVAICLLLILQKKKENRRQWKERRRSMMQKGRTL